jgi:CHAD domain-containing protein
MSDFRIRPDRPAGAELARVLEGWAGAAQLNLRSADREPHLSVHRLRTTMKKLRSGLFLARKELPEQTVAEILEKILLLKNSVADYRDREVLRRTLVRLSNELAVRDSAAGAACLEMVPELFPPVDSLARPLLRKLSTTARELRVTLERAPFWVVTSKGLTLALQFTHNKVLRWRKTCRNKGKEKHFHEWRKAVKHQSTQCLILEKVVPAASRYRQEAEALGEILGEMNDLANLRQILQNAPTRSTELTSALLALTEEHSKKLRHLVL